MKIASATFLINCISFALLAGFYYSPMKAEGSYHIPHTNVNLQFGEQPDYSKFIIPASLLSPRKSHG